VRIVGIVSVVVFLRSARVNKLKAGYSGGGQETTVDGVEGNFWGGGRHCDGKRVVLAECMCGWG
jgi:hypothetical protein